MEGPAVTEDLERLLDAVLPAVVRDSAASESGRLYRSVMGRVEMPLLRLTLELSAGNQLKAARLLGINRNTLRKRLRLLGLLPGSHASAQGAKTK